MFKSKEVVPAAGDSTEVGLLGVDSRFEGLLRFRGTLRIDGTVEGTILSEGGSGSVLIVNQNAVVRANIVSDAVLISGTVDGNICAQERVEIFRAGVLRGDIYTNNVMIEGGAQFQGRCHMLKDLDPARREKLLEEAFAAPPPRVAEAPLTEGNGAGTGADAAEPSTA